MSATPQPIIYLAGYMAAGKTTLGRALEAARAARFVDLDEYISRQSGMTPAEWFATRGEEAFRQAEREALEAIGHDAADTYSEEALPLVVALGGGTPCRAGAMELMKSRGRVIWLEASVDRTVKRLVEADGQRPLVAGMGGNELREFVERHRRERNRWYSMADARFDTSLLDSPEEITVTVRAFTNLFLLK